MKHDIRYGVIGCGSMGREHIENIKTLGGARVTALNIDVGQQVRKGQVLLELV